MELSNKNIKQNIFKQNQFLIKNSNKRNEKAFFNPRYDGFGKPLPLLILQG
jgi:hypothetical protein